MTSIKKQFPIFDKYQDLVYLDNAATTQKPKSVIDRLAKFYEEENASVEGFYDLSVKTTLAYQESRDIVREFLKAREPEEIVFTRGATESINLAAFVIGEKYIEEGDEIISTEMEHHSNLVPWQEVCKRKGAVLKIIPVTETGELDLEEYSNLLNEKTKLVAAVHVSNSLGTVNPIKEITKKAHEVGAMVLIDGAQAAPHLDIDVLDIGCDFYAFSGHKMYSPTGVGALYIKQEIMKDLEPYQTGGKMVETVTLEGAKFTEYYQRFEAGTPNVGDAIGLGEAIKFVQENKKEIKKAEEEVLSYGLKALKEVKGLHILGNPKDRSAVLPFIVDGIHSSDLDMYIAKKGVCIRVGHHCTQPLMKRLGVSATCRASLAVYNTTEDIDKLVSALNNAIKFFG